MGIRPGASWWAPSDAHQRRLAEDWGDGPAIIGVACLFTFAHSQYLIPNAYSVGMVVSLLMTAIGFGVVFAWTRSLIPSIVAHAILNTPMTPAWQVALLAVIVIGALVTARRGASVVKHRAGCGCRHPGRRPGQCNLPKRRSRQPSPG